MTEGDRRPLWREMVGDLPARAADRWHIVRLTPAAGALPVAAAVAVQLVAGVLPVGFVLATARVIGEVPAAVEGGAGSAAWQHLRGWLIAAAALFFAIQLLAPVQVFLGDLVRRRVDHLVRDRLMAASYTGGGVAVLEDPELLDHTADAMNWVRVDGWTPGAACAATIALISRYLQTVLAAVLVAVAFAWWAGVAVLLAGLTIRFGYRLGLSAFGRSFQQGRRSWRMSWYFHDLLTGSGAGKEIRVYGMLGWIRRRYEDAFMENSTTMWRARRRIFYGPYVLYTAVALVLLTLTFAGAAGRAAAGALGIGSLMIVTQAGLSAIRIGGFIAEADVQTEYGMLADQSVRRFEQLTEQAARDTRATDRAAVSSPGESDPAGHPVRDIRFDKVSFRYGPHGALVLDELDLTIPAGQSLAIVGLNGAGKTTLVKLLARLYEPLSGTIRIDDEDIRRFPVRAWQRQVAAIFQDFVRYDLPVRDNVGFGAVGLLDADPVRADEAIMKALRRAAAVDLVADLPGGLDTPLSRQYTGGADLSGGQWQRIAIARALLAVDTGATVLVLDEPTASLDVRAEAEFFDRFLDITQGLTSIVISHRFSTVRRADRIVVLEHGKVVEQGTHDELIEVNGRYAELFAIQAARFADESDEPDESDEEATAVRHG
jgi:ATP-binding cassette subfamily B protein